MKNRKLLIVAIALAFVTISILLLFSCGATNEGVTNTKPNASDIVGSIDTSIENDDLNDDYNQSNATKIVFNNASAYISGSGASASGSDVTITSAGTYIISGSSSDGCIKIDCGKKNKVQIVLDNLDLANPSGPAIYVKSGKKVTVTLADGSENVISDGSSYNATDEETTLDGAIFSKSDLVLNGKGKITVNGNNAHGIISKDGLTITGGNYTVNSAKSGICGKDLLKIVDSNITVKAGTDALKSDNDVDSGMGYVYIDGGVINLTSVNDGIQAFSAIIIEGGSINIKTTSTSSTDSSKALKGGSGVSISGGVFNIETKDDAIHSNGDIVISGGEFTISSGDDGIHADNSLGISGGNIVITKSYEGIEATDIYISGGYIEINSTDDGINASGGNDSNSGMGGRPGGDMFGKAVGSINVSGGYIIMHNEGDGVDSNGSLSVSGGIILVDGPQRGGNGSLDYTSEAKITGGVVIALGTSDMAENFTEAEQGSILVSSSGNFPAGTLLSICDDKGNVILAFTSTKSFRSALFSAPELQKGKTYTFYTGATIEGLDKNGYAHNTTQTGGTSCGTVTLDDYICGKGSGMGGVPGGGPGGGGPGGRPY